MNSEWKEEFDEIFNACGEVPEEYYISFIQAQIDKAKVEVAKEIFDAYAETDWEEWEDAINYFKRKYNLKEKQE